MKPLLLRQIWYIINETQTQILLELSSNELVDQLLLKLEQQRPLSPEENNHVRNYLSSKTSLIRDLAYARMWRY